MDVFVVEFVESKEQRSAYMEQFVLKHSEQGIWYGAFSHFDAAGVKHGISTRLGGTSQLPFSSLNLGLHTGDEEERVIANRHLFCLGVGVEFDDIVTAQQTHGDAVVVVTQEHMGIGAKKYSEALSSTDALVTNVANIPLMLFFADCVPVLIVDPVQKAIGIAHAGWQGTVKNIGSKTICKMSEQFGTKPEDCLVGIGPSIGSCCYEVGDAVFDKIKAQFANWEEFIHPYGEKTHLDLWKMNRMQLEDLGVKSSNIIVSNVCSSCNKDLFFSYRAEDGSTGRIGAVIVL